MDCPIKIPEDLSEVSQEDLMMFQNALVSYKAQRRREMDWADTEIIGIKEELRKRNEKGLLARTFRSAFTKG